MTFRRYIQITVLAIAGNIYLPVSGQENLLREFDAFINKENKTFDNRIKQMNKEFADYLEREWIGFPTYTNQPLSIDPDTFFIKKEETKNRKEEIDIPLEKNNDIRSEAGQLIISFFGKSLSFPFTPSLIIPVNNAGEKAVSNAWRKASEMDYTPLLSMLLHYKKELRLNDWGYLQLVQQTAETIYARHNNPNGAVFLTTYLLNQSSFAARMGRIDNRLALLVEINETIYNVPQLKNDRQTLSIFTGQPLPGNATVFTYKESLRFATERISMHISELPLLDGKCRSAVLPHTWQDQPVTVKVDKALIGFLSTIPQTEFTVYARSAGVFIVGQQLIRQQFSLPQPVGSIRFALSLQDPKALHGLRHLQQRLFAGEVLGLVLGKTQADLRGVGDVRHLPGSALGAAVVLQGLRHLPARCGTVTLFPFARP